MHRNHYCFPIHAARIDDRRLFQRSTCYDGASLVDDKVPADTVPSFRAMPSVDLLNKSNTSERQNVPSIAVDVDLLYLTLRCFERARIEQLKRPFVWFS